MEVCHCCHKYTYYNANHKEKVPIVDNNAYDS